VRNGHSALRLSKWSGVKHKARLIPVLEGVFPADGSKAIKKYLTDGKWLAAERGVLCS
jgi:hypothetical protein